MLVMIMAIGGSVLLSTNVAQARPVVTVSVVTQESYHYQLKATYPERCDQMVLSYDVAYIKNSKIKSHSVRDAANNAREVYAGWYDTSVNMIRFSNQVTVIRINGSTLLF